MQRKERETVQKEIIREIAEGLYNGENFEEAQSRGNFERKLFIDQVSERLKEKLHADHYICYLIKGRKIFVKGREKFVIKKAERSVATPTSYTYGSYHIAHII